MELQFNNNFLNHILLQSIVDTNFLKRIRYIVELDTFRGKERKFLAKIVYDYFDEFKESPQEHFPDLFKEKEKVVSENFYKKCTKLIDVLNDINHSNPEYLISKISTAIKHFKLEEAAVTFAELIKKQKHDEAINTIMRAIKSPEELKQTNIDYFEDTKYIARRLQGKTYKMKTMVEGLDNLIGGFNSTWLIVLLGAAKSGKTAALIEFGVSAMLQGLKVLHISYEMSESEVVDRYDQCIGFFSSEEGGVVQDTMEFVQGKWVKIRKKSHSIYDLEAVSRAKKAIKKFGGGLEIVDFSSGKGSYRDIEVLLDIIENQKGVIFDVLIVDYLGIMGSVEKGQNKKEKIAENTLGLKAIGKERNLIVFTAQQGNRQAMKARTFQSHLIADAIEPIYDSDLVMAICQTDKEEKNNIYRIYIAEARHGKKHESITMVRDLSIGQMMLGTATENLIIKDIDKEDDNGGNEY